MDIGSATPAAGDIVKDTTTANFMKDVIEASQTSLVLVDFWANWCGPCKQLAPVLEKVVKSYGGKVRLVKLDTDAHPSIAAQLRVQSLAIQPDALAGRVQRRGCSYGRRASDDGFVHISRIIEMKGHVKLRERRITCAQFAGPVTACPLALARKP